MAKELMLTNGNVCLVDDEDYDYLEELGWQYRRGYAVKETIIKGTRKKRTWLMHRMIMRLTDPKTKIDHINGNKLDNRKENLRICTQQQNTWNRAKSTLNTTGLKGVNYSKRFKKYVVRIGVGYKRISLGYFDDPRLAAVAYNRAALKYHGEYAQLIKPIGGYFPCVQNT